MLKECEYFSRDYVYKRSTCELGLLCVTDDWLFLSESLYLWLSSLFHHERFKKSEKANISKTVSC